MTKDAFNEEYTARTDSEHEILRCIVGSHAYGTSIDTPEYKSDTDYKGVFMSPKNQVVGIIREQETRRYGPDDHNYSLRHFARLAVKSVPNVIELLWCDEDVVTLCTKEGRALRDNRMLFLSQRCIAPYIGYAQGQIHKAAIVPTNRGKGRQEIVAKHGYDCYAEDTEFLTPNGWKLYDEIQDWEFVGTIHPVTRSFEFQPFSERVKKPYLGTMVHYKGTYYDFLITPNHRIFAWDMHRSSHGTVNVRQKDPMNGAELYIASHSERPVEKYLPLTASRNSHYLLSNSRSPKYIECDNGIIDSCSAFVLAGMYLAEGCVGKRLSNGHASVIRLSQLRGGKMTEPLRKLAHQVDNVNIHEWDGRKDKDEIVTFISDRKLCKFIVDTFGEKDNKHIPYDYLFTDEEVKSLFYGMWLGDGSVVGPAQCYHSKSEKLIDSLQATLAVSGYHTHKSDFPSSGDMSYLHVDEGRFMASCKSPNIEEVQYDGNIVCFSVPNEILVTRRNGFVALQGNTKFAMHTIRLLQTAEELLTEGIVRVRRPNREFLLGIREGCEFANYDAFRKYAQGLIDKVRALEEHCPLPKEPDIDGVNELLITLQERYWAENPEM